MKLTMLLAVPAVVCLAVTLVLAVLVVTASVKSEPSPPYVLMLTINCNEQSNMTQRARWRLGVVGCVLESCYALRLEPVHHVA